MLEQPKSTEMCHTSFVAAAATDTKTWLMHLIIHVTRIDQTDQKQPHDVCIQTKKRREKPNVYESVRYESFAMDSTLQNSKRIKTLDRCQHRCLVCVYTTYSPKNNNIMLTSGALIN